MIPADIDNFLLIEYLDKRMFSNDTLYIIKEISNITQIKALFFDDCGTYDISYI